MRIVGLMLARNESWILRASIPAALAWVDHLVVLNHASTDHSRSIAAGFANETRRVTIGDWLNGDQWDEMDARESTLQTARELGATHIAIVDADEILTHNNLPNVRGWFERLRPGECLDVPMIAPWKSLEVYSYGTRAPLTLGFRDAPHLCWKPRGEEKYHHHHRPPHGSGERIAPVGHPGGVFHLQYAAWKRFVAKHVWYEMIERIRWNYSTQAIDGKYHWWEHAPHGQDLRPIPTDWWGTWNRSEIKIDAESWHEAECRRLVAKHGWEHFKDLNLWGWKP